MMRRLSSFILVGVVLSSAAVFSTPALAQTAPKSSPGAVGIGERYWIEFTASFWQPAATGSVASDRPDLIGSQIDFVGDLALQSAPHGDIKLVVHPARKHKFRFQYSAVGTEGDSVLS